MPLERASVSTVITPVFTPCARAIFLLQPVARMEQPSSVPKNQYITQISATAITRHTAMALGI